MQSVMQSGHAFSRVPEAEIERSSFDRSHGLKTTFNAGYLVPIYLDEALPGDTFNLNLTAFARLATPLKPIMDNMFLDTFFFAVPVRLIWSNWEKFNGAQDAPGDSTSYLVPQIVSTAAFNVTHSFNDYMQIPVGSANAVTFNALHHRAYNLIWNKYFRDENLQTPAIINVGDGPDNPDDYILRRRGKRHDYFTSALPFLQKGTAVGIGSATQAPVKGIGKFNKVFANSGGAAWETDGTNPTYAFYSAHSILVNDEIWRFQGTAATNGLPNIYADLSSTALGTINSLRQAFQLQRMYERDARGGTRYIEILKAHFGVTSPDYRLQRPEYLGGGSTPINISPVPQTSVTAATPQANMAAFGTVTSTGDGFSKSFVEHCVLIGLASVRADLTYQQGLDRMYSRRTRFDYFWPALSHLGEQSILNKEIYWQGTAADELVFGYQERYAEYRYKPSKITGLFRSNVSAGNVTIDYWHLSQNFGSLPTLAATFIQEDPPVSRIIAVPAEPQFLYDSYIRLICARPMPVYGVPGMIDHF